jgi:superkiller protein 3
MGREDAIDWNNKGYSLAGKGLHREALAAYNHAISLDPSNPVFHKNKEKALIAIQRQKKGKYTAPAFEDTIEEKPKSKQDYAIQWNNNAGALFKQGRIDEAIIAYDRAISLDPTHPIFWKNKAKALKTAGRREDSESAQELFESIQAQKNLSPSDDAIYWNNKGYSLAEEGNHINAIDAFNLAIKKHPNFADAWNNLGYSLAELGRIDEAITACYRAVELKPEFAYSWIEKWLFLPELVQNSETIIPINDTMDPESGDPLSSMSPQFCTHASDLIEMDPVFIRSKGDLNKYMVCGWVCPDCGQFRHI